MAEYVYIFASALLAILLAGGTVMLTPQTVRRLEIARLCFLFAFVLLAIMGITFVAVGDAPLSFRIFAGAFSGGVTGFLIYAMWLGIDNEIAELEGQQNGGTVDQPS